MIPSSGQVNIPVYLSVRFLISIMYMILLSLLPFEEIHGQNRYYTLEEVISIAKEQSISYKLAYHTKQIATYNYILYKSNLRPQILMYGTLPGYSREYNAVTQPDGSVIFQPIFQNYSTMGVGVFQRLSATGGELSVNSELNRFDEFKRKEHQYNGTPLFIRLTQPLFGFNELKWQKKIEPLKFAESNRKFVMEQENISQQAADFFFDVLDAEADIAIAEFNLQTVTGNYTIEEGRIALGTTNEDKVLQLRIQMVSSDRDLERAKYQYNIAQLRLRSFIGMKDSVELHLIYPTYIPKLMVDINTALLYAKKFRPEFLSFERKLLEAKEDVAMTKANRQQINLIASFGLNRASSNITQVYQDPYNQQKFSIGFSIPVVDWGRRAANRDIAAAILRLQEIRNEFDETATIQEIATLLSNLQYLQNTILLSKETDSLAIKRYRIANDLYRKGKVSITELSLAQSVKDAARREYNQDLRSFWNTYFFLRKLTLYDFESGQPLYKEMNGNTQ